MNLDANFTGLSRAARRLIAGLEGSGVIDNTRAVAINTAINNDSAIVAGDPNHQMFAELRALLAVPGREAELNLLDTAVTSYFAYKNAVNDGTEVENVGGPLDLTSTADLNALKANVVILAQTNNFNAIIADATNLLDALIANGDADAIAQEVAIRAAIGNDNVAGRAAGFANLLAAGLPASFATLTNAINSDIAFVTIADQAAAQNATVALNNEVVRVQGLNAAAALALAQTNNFDAIIADATNLLDALIANGDADAIAQEVAIRAAIGNDNVAGRAAGFANLLAAGLPASFATLTNAINSDIAFVTIADQAAAQNATVALREDIKLENASNANKRKIAAKTKALHTVHAIILEDVHNDVSDAANAEDYDQLRDSLNAHPVAGGKEHTLIHLLRDAVNQQEAGFNAATRPAVEAASAILSGAIESHVTIYSIHPNAHNVVNASGQPMLTQYQQPVATAAEAAQQAKKAQEAAELVKHVLVLRNVG